MFAQLFGGRRPPADPNNNNNNNESPADPNNNISNDESPTKRIKMEHQNVLTDPIHLQSIVSYLDDQSKLQMAACSKQLYQFFANRATRSARLSSS